MDYEDTKKSKFNAGVAFAERIDSLQRAINFAKFNPLGVNQETGTINYEVIIVALDNLKAEGWDKFTPDEKNTLNRMQNILEGMNEYFPPIIYGKNGERRLHKENYRKFLIFCRRFELKLKDFYGEHDLNSPTSQNEEGL